MKKLSIITISYNNAEGLNKTMESVIGQTLQDFEYVVIDGGSSDNSKNLIERKQEYISYWCSEKDSGIYNAMNKGIRKATGEYLLFLNSGDILHDPTVLEDIYPLLSGEDIVYGDLLFRGENGKGHVFVYPDKLSIDYFLERSLGHPSSFIKRDLFSKDLYSESLKIVSDWEFFLKKIVLEKVSYKHIYRTISIFDTGGVSSQSLDLCNEEMEAVLRKLFPGMLYDALKSAAVMRQSSLFDLFCELNKTRRFQYRIKPLIQFLLKINLLFSKKR
ncbi:glycosyltransferase family 2 protein [uncultured Bacteroides sp.]|uniref:glycosyltransferase family 2 protein n=1 Tax=uncultured Bacteroides sp. TaxID=162156 RepID=UPI0025E86983|nr:glycosyltransferase family 2 protein [uncultured Bacteroides sp.]